MELCKEDDAKGESDIFIWAKKQRGPGSTLSRSSPTKTADVAKPLQGQMRGRGGPAGSETRRSGKGASETWPWEGQERVGFGFRRREIGKGRGQRHCAFRGFYKNSKGSTLLATKKPESSPPSLKERNWGCRFPGDAQPEEGPLSGEKVGQHCCNDEKEKGAKEERNLSLKPGLQSAQKLKSKSLWGGAEKKRD